MACTTILVGKKASYDGSTMIARNDDSGSGSYTPKKFQVMHPEEQAKVYKSVISHVEIPLPGNPMRYTAVPNALKGKGIWAASGVNEAGVGMTATETITSNPRVLGADPLVEYIPAKKDTAFGENATGENDTAFGEKATGENDTALGEKATGENDVTSGENGTEMGKEIPGGIGEEDIVYLVLPYIHNAREGVKRLGSLLEQYGTYEMNGIAFQDVNEIWWLETIGGHHWIARRVPDEAYVVMPNQLGIDWFDIEDALTEQKEYMCSADMKEFMAKHHLDLTIRTEGEPENIFNPRDVFGSHDDADHVYNTPRAWFMERYLNPGTCIWDGEDADYSPYSDDLPWCLIPEKKITVEDVKYVLSSHFQGTPYDPYLSYGDKSMKGAFRSIGINRNDFMALIQMRPDRAEDFRTLQWIAFASNAFNVMLPFYADVEETPDYVSNTTEDASTDNFYWVSRMIAAMADASYKKSVFHIERYQENVLAKGHELINRYDEKLAAVEDEAKSGATEKETDSKKRMALKKEANEAVAEMARKAAQDTLNKVLYELSNEMKNAYSRSDA